MAHMDAHPRRRRQLARGLKEAGLDALVVSSVVNVTYLTGFRGDSSMLVLMRNRAVLVSDGRYAEQIAEECPGLEAVIRPHDRTVHQAVAGVVGGLGVRAVGFESQHLTVAELETFRELVPAVDWAPRRGLVEALRQVKDAGEVAEIRAAVRLAERAYAMLRATLRPGDTEKGLADALDGFVRRAGGEGSSFPAIVAAGARSALPHAIPADRAVGGDGWLLVDWGAAGPLYKSDLTRILRLPADGWPGRAARGRVESRLEKLYTVVLNAQAKALAAIRPGVSAREVDAAARSAIAEAGHGPQFSHGLGHGIGLEVHEGPAVRANSNDVIQAGMVFTVEPGVYLPGFGGVRIEDDVLVTPDGCELLTNVARDWSSTVIE
jgi:Xaa-Pro aminopeptidase